MNDEIISIDVTDETIKEDKQMLILKLRAFMIANVTNEEELIGLMS